MAETLNPKQKEFIRAYKASCGNKAKAAMAVGYNARTAFRLLKNPEVQKELREHEAKLEAKVEEKIMCTVESLFREMEDLQMKVDSEGNRNVQVKLLELKGKLCGLFVDKQEVDIKPLRKLEVEIKE